MASYDAIVIGGGVQGAMAALECVRHRRRPLLVERGRLGDGATAASLGIIHGGLRYLQSADWARWRRARSAQLWFAREFPNQVRPLRCVMPLYRGCLRSPLLFRSAVAMQTVARRLAHLEGSPDAAGLLDAEDVAGRYPVPTDGLVGAAYWDELVLTDPQELMATLANRIRAGGGVILEHETGETLTSDGDAVTGLVTRAGIDGRVSHHHAKTVLICAGSASQALAARFDRPLPMLSARMLAFNLLLDRPLSRDTALAVSPEPGRGRSLFLRPHGNGTLAGTGYGVVTDDRDQPGVDGPSIQHFLSDVVRAAPALAGARVVETWSALLPDDGRRVPSLRDRDVAWDHGRNGGLHGLFTLTATKLTTAHAHARDVLARRWADAVVTERRGAEPLPGDHHARSTE